MASKSHKKATAYTADAFVVFGITGDLAHKMIIPALYRLLLNGRLKAPVIGVALDDWSSDRMAERVRQSVSKQFETVDKAALQKLIAQITYVSGDYKSATVFSHLRDALGHAKRPVFYLAIPPSLFGVVSKSLQKADLTKGARIMIEKPFGHDYASAKSLNDTLHAVFQEESIFRIDHFLGTEAVQNLLYFRFSNSFLEPVWSREHIESVQLTFAENFGVSDRGAFYDEVGAIRDVVENHLLNVLLLLTIEPPVSRHADDLSDVKVQVLKAIRPLNCEHVVRGQFDGYKKILGVKRDSTRETFVALRLAVDNWRWCGVPFFIRTGKLLPVNALEVVVRLRRPPVALFDDLSEEQPNFIRFRLSPEVSIGIGARRKKAGEDMIGEPVELVAVDETADDMLPYERLIGDVMEGRRDLFARQDAAELAWRIFDPVLDTQDDPHPYKPGSWGPEHAMKSLQPPGGWVDPEA